MPHAVLQASLLAAFASMSVPARTELVEIAKVLATRYPVVKLKLVN